MNSKERGFWKRYLESVQKYGLRGVYEVYKNPNQRKVQAYIGLVHANPDARLMTVVAAGCQTFSVGWLLRKEDYWFFRYETTCHSYWIKLDDDMKAEAEAQGICPWKK